MPRLTRLTITPEFIKDITAFIRAGGFPHVAAEAAGVPADVFDAWLARGNRKVRRDSNPLYRQLRDEVRTAKAQARLKAEMAVLEDNPAKWLQQGPGQEKPARRLDGPGKADRARGQPDDQRPAFATVAGAVCDDLTAAGAVPGGTGEDCGGASRER